MILLRIHISSLKLEQLSLKYHFKDCDLTPVLFIIFVTKYYLYVVFLAPAGQPKNMTIPIRILMGKEEKCLERSLTT